jgi:hypothetical protein
MVDNIIRFIGLHRQFKNEKGWKTSRSDCVCECQASFSINLLTFIYCMLCSVRPRSCGRVQVCSLQVSCCGFRKLSLMRIRPRYYFNSNTKALRAGVVWAGLE